MDPHHLAPEFAAECLARCRSYSIEAIKLALSAPNFEMVKGFLNLSMEWDNLADQIRDELNRQGVNKTVSDVGPGLGK